MMKEILPSKHCFFSAPLGTVVIPGTTQLTQKDILYRLQSSKAKCIITNEVLAPAVDAVASKCENLHSKLIVSQKPREGWGNLKEMMKWVAITVVEQLPQKKGKLKSYSTHKWSGKWKLKQ